MRVLIATSNRGKLRDFQAAAASRGVETAGLENFRQLPEVVEDGATFEANARKKAEHYSRFAAGQLVLADDSGLEVDALQGRPGVRSARYASADDGNSVDAANNAKLLGELRAVEASQRMARFVCVISAARDGREIASFRGEAAGFILCTPRGDDGFGYDPLFFSPAAGKTFAELTPEEKARFSHRGAALQKFLAWAAAHENR